LDWVNGNAVEAVTGASTDYIAPHFHVAMVFADNAYTYAPEVDLAKLVEGGVQPRLAVIIVMMRRIVFSIPGVVVNRAEIKRTRDPAIQTGAVIDEAEWSALAARRGAVMGILQMTYTILGINAYSMITKGHHYVADDPVWARLNDAVTLDELFTLVGISNWEGAIFHDALHPYALEWKARLVTTNDSVIIGKVHGVLSRRLPATPAGTSIIAATIAAIGQLVIVRPSCGIILTPLKIALDKLKGEIIAEPLNWCATFQQAATVGNLQRVQVYEPFAAFVHGMCVALFPRKSSLLKSPAFASNATRNPAYAARGNEYGSSLDSEVLSVSSLYKLFYDLTPANDRAGMPENVEVPDIETAAV
jgi:hypothetical protein